MVRDLNLRGPRFSKLRDLGIRDQQVLGSRNAIRSRRDARTQPQQGKPLSAQQKYRLGRTFTVITAIAYFTIDITSTWYFTVGYFTVALTALYLVATQGPEE